MWVSNDNYSHCLIWRLFVQFEGKTIRAVGGIDGLNKHDKAVTLVYDRNR